MKQIWMAEPTCDHSQKRNHVCVWGSDSISIGILTGIRFETLFSRCLSWIQLSLVSEICKREIHQPVPD